MSSKSGFEAFRAFMTPGKILIALLVLFFALPSALVWTGVASFGAGKASSNTNAEPDARATRAESDSGRSARSESNAKPEKAASASTSAAAGGSSTAREPAGEAKELVRPALNPGLVARPMANVVGTGDRAQDSNSAPQTPTGVTAANSPGLRAVPLSAQGSGKAEASALEAPGGKTGSTPGEKPAQVSPADQQLEEKLRAALGARMAAGGQLTITYSGDVVEKAPVQAGGPPAAKAGPSGAGAYPPPGTR